MIVQSCVEVDIGHSVEERHFLSADVPIILGTKTNKHITLVSKTK